MKEKPVPIFVVETYVFRNLSSVFVTKKYDGGGDGSSVNYIECW